MEEQVAAKLAELFSKRKSMLPGLTFDQISDALSDKGVSLSKMHIYRIHSGVVQKPSFLDVMALADFYQISPDELLSETGLTDEQQQESDPSWKRNVRTQLESFLGQATETDGKLAQQLLEVLTARLRGGESASQAA